MKTKILLVIGLVAASVVFGTYQLLMYQCSTLPIFVETPYQPDLWKCLKIWEHAGDNPFTGEGYFED